MIMVTAHAGCEGTIPNSKENISKAIELDADYIEIDVRPTKDGYGVLSHDDEIGEVTISKTNLQTLQNKFSHIVTLEEGLEYIIKNNKKVNLDIKTMEVIQSVVKEVDRLDIKDQVILSGCHQEQVEYVHQIDSSINMLLNVDHIIEQQASKKTIMSEILHLYNKYNLKGINVPFYYLDRVFMDIMKTNQVDVYVWTVDDELDMLRCMDFGVKSVTTNKLSLINRIKNK